MELQVVAITGGWKERGVCSLKPTSAYIFAMHRCIVVVVFVSVVTVVVAVALAVVVASEAHSVN